MPEILESVHVGLPQALDAEQPWVTSIYKVSTEGPVWLRRENLDGDRQADLRVHGGVDKAVCVYAVEHLAAWSIELGIPDIRPGAFGENFSVSGETEATVYVGDIYRVGSAVVQVAQPRGPCWKVARRWRRPDLTRRIVKTGRTGWYLRVLTRGVVAAGDRFDRLERPYPQWSIQRVNDLSYNSDADLADVRALATCPVLARAWRNSLSG